MLWTDLDKAHRFGDRQKVENYMQQNFSGAVKGQTKKSDVEILPCDEHHIPFEADGGTSPVQITEEQANTYLDSLPDMIGQMYETGKLFKNGRVDIKFSSAAYAQEFVENYLRRYVEVDAA